MIVGGSGSGKSTLTRKLGAKLGVPVYHMDRDVLWLPGWVERPRHEKAPLVQAIVARDARVFESGHSSTYDMRLARADMLIWTDALLWLRLWRVTWRSLRQRGQTRPESAKGCPERLRGLPGFWMCHWINRKRFDAKLEAVFAQATILKRMLAGFDEIDAFLKEF